MAEEKSSQLNLTVVALVAVVAIVGLVALVFNAGAIARISTGAGFAEASEYSAESAALEESNLAGEPTRADRRQDCIDGCNIRKNSCLRGSRGDEGRMSRCDSDWSRCSQMCR